MLQITKTTVDKYLDVLTYIHDKLKESPRLSMNAVCKEKTFTYNAIVVMTNCGLIKSNGMRGPGCEWEWSTPIAPNEEMAKKLIQKINTYVPEKKEKVVKPETLLKNFPAVPVKENKEKLDMETMISDAIHILKGQGYKIQKPVFVEV